jgi:hypothetical protein
MIVPQTIYNGRDVKMLNLQPKRRWERSSWNPEESVRVFIALLEQQTERTLNSTSLNAFWICPVSGFILVLRLIFVNRVSEIVQIFSLERSVSFLQI